MKLFNTHVEIDYPTTISERSHHVQFFDTTNSKLLYCIQSLLEL